MKNQITQVLTDRRFNMYSVKSGLVKNKVQPKVFNSPKRTESSNTVKEKKIYTILDIHKVVCDTFGISDAKMMSKTRKREVVYARYIAWYLSYKYLRMTLDYIGEFYGGKDHATIINGRDSVIEAIENPKRNQQLYDLYLRVIPLCEFKDVEYKITSILKDNKWSSYRYSKRENIIEKERYVSEDRRHFIIKGRIIENNIIIAKGYFKGIIV